jgi:hypothetical protein
VRLVLDGSEHADTLSQIQGCQNQHPTLDRQHGIRVPGRPASVKKSIYGPIDLREILLGCNRRYLAHLSALNDFSAGIRALDRLTRPRNVEGKAVKGINFFEPGDSALLQALQNPRVILPASAAPTCCPTWECSRRHGYRGNCADCWISESSSGLSGRTVTINRRSCRVPG